MQFIFSCQYPVQFLQTSSYILISLIFLIMKFPHYRGTIRCLDSVCHAYTAHPTSPIPPEFPNRLPILFIPLNLLDPYSSHVFHILCQLATHQHHALLRCPSETFLLNEFAFKGFFCSECGHFVAEFAAVEVGYCELFLAMVG